jgi:NAD(P)-dependent dehydrogenase (short-subunit alcohol dehydrogenase family)
MKKMNVLITGAASGIGFCSAIRLAEAGHRVFALDVKGADLSGASDAAKENICSMISDITDKQSLEAVGQHLADEGVVLDAILCIAGVHMMASLAESEPEKMRRLIEVNLWGTMLTVRVFHSSLAKDGRVIIVSSEVAAYDPMPFNGLYNVSKTAIDCYAQALRQEIGLIGQRVITVRPGAVMTPLAVGSADSTRLLADSTVLYRRQARHFSSLVKNFTGTPMPPSRFAATVYKATVSKRPRLIYHKNRNPGLILLSLLPKRLQCGIIKMLLNR